MSSDTIENSSTTEVEKPDSGTNSVVITPQPSGSTSTTPRKCSMKEYKQRIDILERENFNLKLHIYFIEEHQKKLKSVNDVETLVKANNDLKLQLELMKKDLEDKEDLLVQTAKAFELLRENYKENLKDLKHAHEKEKEDLLIRIQCLENELNDKDRNMSDESSSLSTIALGLKPKTKGDCGDFDHHVCRLHSGPCCDSMDGNSHSIDHARDLEKQLKNTHAKLQKQEDRLNELQTKYTGIEQLIVETDERISMREKDYYKACILLREALHSNKQLKEENVKPCGNTDSSGTFSESQSQTESLQQSSVSNITSVSQADRNHQFQNF